MTDPLFLALIDKLPPAGSVWPLEQRARWLSTMSAAMDLVFGPMPVEAVKIATPNVVSEQPPKREPKIVVRHENIRDGETLKAGAEPKKGAKLSLEVVAERERIITEMWMAGASAKAIGERLNLVSASVFAMVKKMRLPKRSLPRGQSEQKAPLVHASDDPAHGADPEPNEVAADDVEEMVPADTASERVISKGGVTVDLFEEVIEHDGRKLDLTTDQARLLGAMLNAFPEAVAAPKLIREVYGSAPRSEERFGQAAMDLKKALPTIGLAWTVVPGKGLTIKAQVPA